MATSFQSGIDGFIADNLSPAARSKALTDAAIKQRDELIASGQARRQYTTTVDGVENGDANSAKKNINYRFSYLGDAVKFSLAYLKGRVTHVSGNLSQSFFVSIDGRYFPPGITPDYQTIQPKAEIVIGNTAPYWRKADINYVGDKQLQYRSPNVLNDCVSAVKREFGPSAISAIRLNDYSFPTKYLPKHTDYIYQSPVIVLSET